MKLNELPQAACIGKQCLALLLGLLMVALVSASLENDKAKLNEIIDDVVNTKAIGVMSKLSLKGDINKLFKDLKAAHVGTGKASINELEERYLVLAQKLEMAVKKKDSELASKIAGFRDRLWENLKDKESFASLAS